MKMKKKYSVLTCLEVPNGFENDVRASARTAGDRYGGLEVRDARVVESEWNRTGKKFTGTANQRPYRM
jgi:hypothetical protein